MLWGLLLRWTMPRVLEQPFLIRLLAMLGCAGWWVVLEWVRGWLFTGFPWLPLAASHWERPTSLQLLEWTGSGGLSFVLIFFNMGLAFFIYHVVSRRYKGKGRGRILDRLCPDLYASLAALLAMLLLFLQNIPDQRAQVTMFKAALIQPNAPVQDIRDDEARDLALKYLWEQTIEAAETAEPDIIIWPESSLSTLPAIGDPRGKRFAENLVVAADYPVIGGALAQDADHLYNAVIQISPAMGISDTFYAKRHLVPFGEYVLWESLFPFLRKIVPYEGEFYEAEKATVLPLSINGEMWGVGSLICYEDAFAELARQNVLEKADLLLVLTNNAWFGEEGGAYQHAAHSVLRAVETRRPVVRCGNGGWSGWIDPFGTIRKVLTDDRGSIYFRGWGVVEPSYSPKWEKRETFYVKHGNWFLYVCFIFVLFAAVLPLRLKGSESSSVS